MSELASIIQRHGWELPGHQLAALERYCQALWEWNTHINLTRHSDFESFAARDLVDTLQLSQLLRPNEVVLDVGSGGGIPGLTLAILRPDLKVTLTDSVAKKARALERLAESAGVHVEVYAARAESLLQDFRFDSALARAVGPLDRMLGWFHGQWDVLGRLLAVKGPRWREELAQAEKRGLMRSLTCRAAATYDVPGLGWVSTILEIRAHE